MTAREMTVGEMREILAAKLGVTNADTTHYVIITDAPDGFSTWNCCDDVDRAAKMLDTARGLVTGEIPNGGEATNRVIVKRDDLAYALDLAGEAAAEKEGTSHEVSADGNAILARLAESLAEGAGR